MGWHHPVPIGPGVGSGCRSVRVKGLAKIFLSTASMIALSVGPSATSAMRMSDIGHRSVEAGVELFIRGLESEPRFYCPTCAAALERKEKEYHRELDARAAERKEAQAQRRAERRRELYAKRNAPKHRRQNSMPQLGSESRSMVNRKPKRRLGSARRRRESPRSRWRRRWRLHLSPVNSAFGTPATRWIA